MCSIAGIINAANREAGLAAIERMNRAQAHRGPDDSGVWSDAHAVFGHRRLSIIDLAGGHQPMGSPDGQIQIVFNGEIYNHCQLRDYLQARGHHFRTAGDTEVILHLYLEYGAACPEHLHGMFAFGIWDAGKKQLLLARDRIGQKPLIYFQKKHKLVFASEFAALREEPDFPSELNPAAISDFLSLQYVPAAESVYTEVKKLPPAGRLIFDAATGESRIERYWRADYGRKNTAITFEDAAAETRRLLTAAVKKRLMAEVPSGAFLSGGLDSAIIATLMTELRRPERTSAFTVAFDHPDYDESREAEISFNQINRLTGDALDQHWKTVQPENFALLRKLSRHYGEPFADASMLPTALLCEFAREQATVILSGDGADEVFAGYERYLVMKYAGRFRFVPPRLFGLFASGVPDRGERTSSGRFRRLLKVLANPAGRRYFSILDRCPPELKQMLAGERLRDAAESDSAAALTLTEYSARNEVERCMETDLERYLPGDILPKVDIASMASGLEVRNPFLDHELVEFAASLPLDFKQCGRSRKHILKAAFADLIAPEILNVRKRGFGVPVGDWLRGGWSAPAREALFTGRLLADGWIDPARLETIWRAHGRGERDYSYLLFNLIVLALFLDNH